MDKKGRFNNHFVVCGWNERGPYCLERLSMVAEKDHIPIVLLCEQDENPFEGEDVFFFFGNPVSEKELKRVSVAEARSVIVLADASHGGKPDDIDARTVMCALTIKSIASDMRITAEVLEPQNAGHLERAGVGEILNYSAIAGSLLAQSAQRYGLMELITAMSTSSDVSRTRMFPVPVTRNLVGKTYGEVEDEYPCAEGVVVAVRNEDGTVHFERLKKVQSGDILLVMRNSRPDGAIDWEEKET